MHMQPNTAKSITNHLNRYYVPILARADIQLPKWEHMSCIECSTKKIERKAKLDTGIGPLFGNACSVGLHGISWLKEPVVKNLRKVPHGQLHPSFRLGRRLRRSPGCVLGNHKPRQTFRSTNMAVCSGRGCQQLGLELVWMTFWVWRVTIAVGEEVMWFWDLSFVVGLASLMTILAAPVSIEWSWRPLNFQPDGLVPSRWSIKKAAEWSVNIWTSPCSEFLGIGLEIADLRVTGELSSKGCWFSGIYSGVVGWNVWYLLSPRGNIIAGTGLSVGVRWVACPSTIKLCGLSGTG